MREVENNKPLRIVRFGGYLIILGVLLGAVIGVLAVVNPWFSSRLVGISQYEATGFFLSVNLPTSALLVALGYIFVISVSLDGRSKSRSILFCLLSLVCLVASALSVFNFLSFLGGLVVLIGVLLDRSEPSFHSMWAREASFLAEFGAMLLASSGVLFSFMWLVARFLSTYLMGAWRFGFLYPSAFLIIAVIAFLMFFLVAVFGLRNSHPGASGSLNLILTIAVSLIAVQNQYLYLNLSGYLGVLLLIIGITSEVFGSLINIRLSLSGMPELDFRVSEISPSYGRYCAYCGGALGKFAEFKSVCSQCGRKAAWRPGAPFCPHCARVVPKDLHVCPHCQERLD